MAFQEVGVFLDRGSFNGTKGPNQLGEHSYRTAVDTLATVSAISFDNPYFPPFMTGNAQTVQIGDLVEVSALDGFDRYKIVALDPFAMVLNGDVNPDPDFNNITTHTITFDQTSTPPGPSQLDFYAENVSVPLTFTGPYAEIGVDTIATVSRIGKMVTMNVQGFSGNTVGASSILQATIPEWLQLSGSALSAGAQHVDGFEAGPTPFIGKAFIAPSALTLSIKKLDGTVDGLFLSTSGILSVSDFTISYSIN